MLPYSLRRAYGTTVVSLKVSRCIAFCKSCSVVIEVVVVVVVVVVMVESYFCFLGVPNKFVGTVGLYLCVCTLMFTICSFSD